MQSPASRRNVLQALGTLSITTTGCLAGNSLRFPSRTEGDPSLTPTDYQSTPTPTETIDCTEPRRPEIPVVTGDDRVEPRNYPEKPDELTVGTVETYVRVFERAYKVNQAIREYELVAYDFLDWGVSDVHEADEEVVATVGGHVTPFWYQGTSTETTPYHADEEYIASYLVFERGVWRAARTGSDPPDPRDGELLVCTP